MSNDACKKFLKRNGIGATIQRKESKVGTVRYQVRITIPTVLRKQFGNKDQIFIRDFDRSVVEKRAAEWEKKLLAACKQYVVWTSTSDVDLWKLMRRWKRVSPEAR